MLLLTTFAFSSLTLLLLSLSNCSSSHYCRVLKRRLLSVLSSVSGLSCRPVCAHGFYGLSLHPVVSQLCSSLWGSCSSSVWSRRAARQVRSSSGCFTMSRLGSRHLFLCALQSGSSEWLWTMNILPVTDDCRSMNCLKKWFISDRTELTAKTKTKTVVFSILLETVY